MPASQVSDPETVVCLAASFTVPEHYALSPNFPNPFNASTAIAYQLPAASHVSLTIYDVLDRKVRTLLDDHRQAGSHTVLWDGRDDQGCELRSGVYFCNLEVDHFSEVMKMVLTR